MKVEYRHTSPIWYSLICEQSSLFRCALCQTPYMKYTNIVEHVHGRRHLTNSRMAQELHHPVYCIAPDRAVNFAEDTEMPSPKKEKPKGKENLVLNPMAVLKGSNQNKPQVPELPPGQKFPTVISRQRTEGDAGQAGKSQLGKRPAPTTHPGLQPPSKQAKGPSFATKTFTNKPDDDKNIEGYIGVEYVVKILQNATDPSPRFECCLCEVESDGYGMQAHLKSLQHRLKYLVCLHLVVC